MKLMPQLCKVDSALRRLSAGETTCQTRLRALDVGGGVGRTTKDVLLHLVDDVVLIEPVHKVHLLLLL
jgi:protein N-terminal methyltransferase